MMDQYSFILYKIYDLKLLIECSVATERLSIDTNSTFFDLLSAINSFNICLFTVCVLFSAFRIAFWL